MTRALALVLAAVVALAAAACGGSDDPPAGSADAAGSTVTVFAASSLKEAFTAIGDAFEAANPGTSVTFQFAGSDELATQLREGAAADVYAAASPRYPDELAADGLLAPPVAFATNTLVIATPAGSSITAPAAIAEPGVKLVIGAEGVPIGDYTRKVLAALDASEGAGFAERALANVVSEEQSVKGIVAKLASGDADAGLVYVTDVRAADGALAAVAIPPAAEPGARYPIAVTATPPAGALAQRFVDLVRGAEGQRLLAEAGFGPPPPA